jgi:hypothetical protein
LFNIYITEYLKIIKNSKKTNTNEYVEKHHIRPICICKLKKVPSKIYNKKSNKVNLTPKEHFIANKLLYLWALSKYGKSHVYTRKLCHAWHSFQMNNNGERDVSISAEDYEELRLAYIKTISGDNHWTRRLGVSEETRKKQSINRSGDKNHNYKRKYTPEELEMRSGKN